MFLEPDKIIKINVGNKELIINQKITPDNARASKDIADWVKKGDPVKPCKLLSDGSGKVKGITIHNTDTIKAQTGTNPAEQYARATYPNGNMGGAAVHYWIYKDVIWQQLNDNERGWHAGDGQTRKQSQRKDGGLIGGNLDTISIESIQTGTDSETEDTTARLTAYLLYKYDLSPETDVYTHNYFAANKKYCPAYILPRWDSFKALIKKYYDELSGSAETKEYVVIIKGFKTQQDAQNAANDFKQLYGYDAYVENETTSAQPVPESETKIKVGSKVKVKQGAKDFNGGNLAGFVYTTIFDVQSITGDRVVIGLHGQVTAAVNINDLVLA